MSAYFGSLYLQLAGVAAGAALLCAACSREEGVDVRFWLWLAVIAVTLYAATATGALGG